MRAVPHRGQRVEDRGPELAQVAELERADRRRRRRRRR